MRRYLIATRSFATPQNLQPPRLPLEGVVPSRDRKPRVLLVVAHFDDTRNPNGRPNFIPQGLAHAFLAGAFHRRNVEVRLYSEFHSGPLKDERAFAWPDMLVLTGVTSAFDRMRQLAAYVRIKSPHCVVVTGGPAVRNLPISSAAAFDYACHGDIEELAAIAEEEFGPDAVAEQMLPRFDLLTWKSRVNYVETTPLLQLPLHFLRFDSGTPGLQDV